MRDDGIFFCQKDLSRAVIVKHADGWGQLRIVESLKHLNSATNRIIFLQSRCILLPLVVVDLTVIKPLKQDKILFTCCCIFAFRNRNEQIENKKGWMTLAHFPHASTFHRTVYIFLLCCLCCLVPNETARQQGSGSSVLCLAWKNPARDREPRVWRTGEISRSVTVLSKRNGTLHPQDNSRALVNVLMEDVKCMCALVVWGEAARERERAKEVLLLFFRLG